MRQGRRWLQALLVCVLLCGAPLTSAANAEVVLTLPPSVEVDQEALTVGEVASLEGQPAELLASIAAVPLGVAPPAGVSRTVTGGYLALRLRQAGIGEADMVFAGEQSTKVTRRVVTVDPEAVAEAVRAFVEEAMAGEDLEVEMYSPARALLAPGRTAQVILDTRASSLLKPGYNLLHARVVVDGEAWRVVPVHVRIRTFVPGLVALRDLFPGTPISAEDFVLERVEITQAVRQPVSDYGVLTGKRLRRFLRNGGPLSASDLEPLPPVAKRQQVIIRVVLGGVMVSCPGVAQRDGVMGEMVAVISGYDARRLTARVVGPGLLEIAPPSPVEGSEANAQ